MRIVIFLIAFIFNCNSAYVESSSQPDADTLIAKVSNQTIAQLREEQKLCACGHGSGGWPKIRMLALSFNYYEEVDIDQARELLMTAGTVYLNTINSNEQIHPFLLDDPFTPENIQIRIFIYKPNGREPDPGKLTVLSLLRGILEYDIRSSDTQRLTTINEETFDQAQAKMDSLAVESPSK